MRQTEDRGVVRDPSANAFLSAWGVCAKSPGAPRASAKKNIPFKGVQPEVGLGRRSVHFMRWLLHSVAFWFVGFQIE